MRVLVFYVIFSIELYWKVMTHLDKLTVIIGPSGAGKSTHVAELLRYADTELVRTETDRPRRGPDDDDTHTFVTTDEFTTKRDTNYYLGHGAMGGFNYGLPHLPQTDTSKVILLRAPFIPEVWRHRPDARVIQFEASTDTLVQRLETRGDHARIDPKLLAAETAMGRKLTSYIISTDVPFSQSYAAFVELWNKIQAE